MNNFDFRTFFQVNDINFKSSGKNIGTGAGWLGVETCPRCGKGNYHVAANTKTAAVNCWSCGGIKLTEFIKLLLNTNWRKAKEIQAQFKLDPEFIIDTQEEVEYIPVTSYQLPKQFTETFPTEAKDYIKNRGFDFLNLRKKYGILWSGEYGREKFRIVFPVTIDGKVVNWIGRSIISDKNIIPYQFGFDTDVAVPRRDLLFNLDSVKSDKAILVEGVMDAVAIGDGAVAMLSMHFSRGQILALKNKGIKKFYLCFDNEEAAQKRAKELEGYLTFADSIEYIILPEYAKDPAELREEDIKFIKRMCL